MSSVMTLTTIPGREVWVKVVYRYKCGSPLSLHSFLKQQIIGLYFQDNKTYSYYLCELSDTNFFIRFLLINQIV